MKLKKVVLLVLAFALVFSLTSCAGQEEEAKKEEKYKIGAILSISGAGSPLGIPERDALKMIEKKINDEGGIDGTPIELIIEDDETNPTKASQAARKLIQKDEVIAIIGSSVSPCSLAVKEIINEEEVPLVCLSAANAITDTDYKWIFRMPPKDAIAVAKVLTYIQNETDIKEVAILHDSNPFGQSGADEIQERAEEFGLEVVEVQKYETNAPDLTAQLTKIREANPDALIVWGTNPGPANAAKTMEQLGMDIPYIGSHGIANQKFIELAGDSAEGVVFPAGKILVPDEIPQDDPQKEIIDKFIEEYEAEYNEQPNTFAGHAYDAMLLLEKVLKETGADREKIREKLENTTGFVAIDGVFNFSETNHDGLSVDDMYMIKIENGSWTRVK